jgi:hypothetical protein
LESDCPSVDVQLLLGEIEGAPVLSRAQLAAVVDNCLADGELIATSLERGGALDVVNANRWGSLHQAARAHARRLLPMLLEAGADPQAKTLHVGQTALHIAVSAGDGVAVAALLRSDPALLGVEDAFGRTAFELACMFADGSARGGGMLMLGHELAAWPAWLRAVVDAMQTGSDTHLECGSSSEGGVSLLKADAGTAGSQPALLAHLPAVTREAVEQPCGIAERDGERSVFHFFPCIHNLKHSSSKSETRTAAVLVCTLILRIA